MFLLYVIELLLLFLFLLGKCYIRHRRMKGKANKKTQVMAAHGLEMIQNFFHNEGPQDRLPPIYLPFLLLGKLGLNSHPTVLVLSHPQLLMFQQENSDTKASSEWASLAPWDYIFPKWLVIKASFQLIYDQKGKL